MQVQDLNAGDLQQVASNHDVRWFVVVDAPLMDLGVAEKVLRLAGAKAGIEVLETLTARQVLDFFVQVDDDVPILVPPTEGGGPLSSGTADSTAG